MSAHPIFVLFFVQFGKEDYKHRTLSTEASTSVAVGKGFEVVVVI